jgi:hypothetical protein
MIRCRATRKCASPHKSPAAQPCIWLRAIAYEPWKVGEGRNTRQPGQVRKEAAPTRPCGSSSSLPLSTPSRAPRRQDQQSAQRRHSHQKICERMAEESPGEMPDQPGFLDAGLLSTPANGWPSSAYKVLARKYRPKDFTDLIGQDAMVRTLSNAFSSGRIPQAWMLTGVRGVGKTTTARILARGLNFQTDGWHRSAHHRTGHARHPLPGHHRGSPHRRAGDRRGLQQQRRQHPPDQRRACAIRRFRRATRSTSSTKCTCSRARPSTPS